MDEECRLVCQWIKGWGMKTMSGKREFVAMIRVHGGSRMGRLQGDNESWIIPDFL